MTNEVIEQAALEGFELEERLRQDAWVCGWARGDDRRWPCYLETRQAIDWMRDRLSRGRVFSERPGSAHVPRLPDTRFRSRGQGSRSSSDKTRLMPPA